MNLTTTSVPKAIELKILTAIDLKKQLEQYEKEIKSELLDAMQAHDVLSIKNDKYSVSLITKRTFKGANRSFMKQALDTKKVGDYHKLYKKLPAGVTITNSAYVKWEAR